jgi:2,5-diamino-6-(ribosylamino)-4(3H)-pyrimidinone 5'-phosphate reductase
MSVSQRPYIVCHMMQTLDGKIASGVSDVEIIMDHFDTYTEIEKQFDSKVWMFGRKTGGAFAIAQDSPLSPIKNDISDEDFIAEHSGDTFAVIVDTHGVLRWEKNFINLSNQTSEFKLIVIVSQLTPKEYLAYLQDKKISYMFGGASEVDFQLVLKKLKDQFNIEKILLEGGGSFNGSLMASSVVDEISLLLIPRVLNKKNAPSIFDQDTNEVHTTDFILFCY